MTTKHAASRHEYVNFQFFGAEESELPGTVIIRGNEMVLDIPGGYGPYLIIGIAREHWYEGTNSAHGRNQNVSAAWARIGEIYLGRWIEGGYEYFFKFELR
jgi:hypothetical protein